MALIAAFLWWRASATSTPPGSTHGAPAARDAPTVTAAHPGAVPAADGDEAEPPPLPSGPTESEVRAFRQHRVETLREAARYPGDSAPLVERYLEALTDPLEDVGPVTADDEPDPLADGRQQVLVAYPIKPHFQIDEPAILHAEVRDLGRKTRLPATITATLRKRLDGDGQPLATIEYGDRGADGDDIAGDLVYTARVTTKTLAPEVLAGQIDLDVSARLDDGRRRAARSQFRMGTPGAVLTGEFADHLQDGHLMLDAGVEVTRAGRYHLQGGLVTLDGALIAWSQNAVELKPGAPTMSLRFFGLAFRDAGLPGPYRLAFISIAETGRRPVWQGPVLRDAYVTRAYAVDEFSDQPYDDPSMQDTIRHAEELESAPFGPGVRPDP